MEMNSVRGAIRKIVPLKGDDGRCPFGQLKSKITTNPILIKGSGAGIGIRYLSAQSVVKKSFYR